MALKFVYLPAHLPNYNVKGIKSESTNDFPSWRLARKTCLEEINSNGTQIKWSNMVVWLPFFFCFPCSLLHVKWMNVCMLVNRHVLTAWQPSSEHSISVRPQADWMMSRRAAKWKMRGEGQEEEEATWKRSRSEGGQTEVLRRLNKKKGTMWLWLCLRYVVAEKRWGGWVD